jgi:hypothetical protein
MEKSCKRVQNSNSFEVMPSAADFARSETGQIQSPMICCDTDFHTALELVKILIQHAARIYEALPAEIEKPKQPNQKQLFLEALPPEFSRQDYLTTARSLNIPDKTAEKHIAKFTQNGLVSHFAHDKYKKA